MNITDIKALLTPTCKQAGQNQAELEQNLEDETSAVNKDCLFLNDFMLKSLDNKHPGVWTRNQLEAGKLIGPVCTIGESDKVIDWLN